MIVYRKIRSVFFLFSLGFVLANCTTTGDLPEEDSLATNSETTNLDNSEYSSTSNSNSVSTLPIDMIHFDFDQNNIKAEFKSDLYDLAAFIKNNPGSTLRIEGHCDDIGTAEYNLALGQRRAEAVKAYLAALGIDSSRLVTISYGEEKLLDHSGTTQGNYKNRRAEFSTESSSQRTF